MIAYVNAVHRQAAVDHHHQHGRRKWAQGANVQEVLTP